MDTAEYHKIITEGNVLDFKTLQLTRTELTKLGDVKTLAEIDRILKFNKVEKPELHGDKDNEETNHYFIDLDVDSMERIIDMCGDLEVNSLDIDYNSTRQTTIYASLLDKWNDLPDWK